MKNIILLFILVIVAIAGLKTYRNAKEEKPLVVIMMGAPGAGKGAHAQDLSKTLNIAHISTGDLFRENIKNETQLGNMAKDLMDKGLLVPDKIAVDMLFKHIRDNGFDKTGYILDGFPRTLIQAKALDERLARDYKKIAVNLSIDEEKLVQRITGRLICKSCAASYHKENLPPKQDGICDNCSDELYQRDDDTEEVLKTRLEAYNKDTKPLLDYYQNKKILKDIDSNDTKEVVFENLLNTVKS
ncbi:MAG: adenylate kinase [Candidatus Anoxychlamydiales bacterium]|nr:adenylate kinase [Candidatus Anoxychlamydiales bacterium]NGX35550.1 adenylate kinase [Candidatus Anoxychlamydiales bacterium]